MSKHREELAAQAFSFLDLTSLTDSETLENIQKLAENAVITLPEGERIHVAALCVFPRYVPYARAALNDLELFGVKIATVTNFPHGGDDIDIAVAETKAALAYGADEVDVVFPYRAFLNGDETIGKQLVQACKAVCQDKALLKVIIETGELKTSENIQKASQIALKAGADFIKTSTGKVAENATPESAQLMLSEIAKNQPTHAGFKPAGGIKTLDDAIVYMDLVSQTLGPQALTPARFRIGASSVRGDLATVLTGVKQQDQGAY